MIFHAYSVNDFFQNIQKDFPVGYLLQYSNDPFLLKC